MTSTPRIRTSFALLVLAVLLSGCSVERLVEVLCECGMLVGGMLLILGTAMGLTNLLITEHVPDRLTVWIDAAIDSPWIFLMILNLVMIVLGYLMPPIGRNLLMSASRFRRPMFEVARATLPRWFAGSG